MLNKKNHNDMNFQSLLNRIAELEDKILNLSATMEEEVTFHRLKEIAELYISADKTKTL